MTTPTALQILSISASLSSGAEALPSKQGLGNTHCRCWGFRLGAPFRLQSLLRHVTSTVAAVALVCLSQENRNCLPHFRGRPPGDRLAGNTSPPGAGLRGRMPGQSSCTALPPEGASVSCQLTTRCVTRQSPSQTRTNPKRQKWGGAVGQALPVPPVLRPAPSEAQLQPVPSQALISRQQTAPWGLHPTRRCATPASAPAPAPKILPSPRALLPWAGTGWGRAGEGKGSSGISATAGGCLQRPRAK